MPSKTEDQHKAMCAASHSPQRKGGIPKKVAKEYCNTDRGGKFDKGTGSRHRGKHLTMHESEKGKR